jgi:hypothetical protein
MKQTLLFFGILIIALRLTAQADATTPRIALMDFVSDDNSYRSTVAMGNLAAILQTEVSQNTNYEWVERAELEKSVNEFKLAGFGLIDRSEAIRSGRWVKADWAVFGDVSTNFNSQRNLTLEIVNLQRADVLAETNLSLSSEDNGPFQMKSEYVPQIASALRTLLAQARDIYLASARQDAVAFLFLSFTQSGSSEPWGDLDADFRHALLIESAKNQQFHLVQFQRAGAAMDEASLVLSGLAETDSNAWEKVANHYVWGDAHLDDRKTFDWETKAWQDERILQVKLNVWDGSGEPQVAALTVTNEASEAVARELTQAIEPLFRPAGTKPIIENIRNQISDSIFAHYKGLPVDFRFYSPEDRRQWFDAVQLLETACFFNPANAPAREQLLRLRWGSALGGSDAGKIAATIEHVTADPLLLAQQLESASRNKFFFVRRRNEAWGKYVEQFGLTSALAQPGLSSIASEYVLSAWQPFEMFEYAQDERAEWGMPRDAGLHEVTQWKNQFGSDFVSRLLAVPQTPALVPRSTEFFYHSLSMTDLPTRTRMIEQYWPQILKQARRSPIEFSDYMLYLRKYFIEIDQPDGDQKLLAQLDAANKEGTAHQAATAPPRLVQLPRLADLDIAQTKDLFSVPLMLFPPPLVEPHSRTISFPAGVEVKGVKAMAFHDDTLWLIVIVSEPLKIETVNGQIEKEFQPVTVDHARLWKLPVNATQPGPVTGPLATNDVNNLMFEGDTLWLALDDDGIAALDVKTGHLQRYDSPTGIIATNQFALASTSRGIAAIGGMSDLTFLDNTNEAWRKFTPELPYQNFLYGGDMRKITGLNEKLLFYNSQMLLCDLASNTWTRVANTQTLDQLGRINCLASNGKKNFWIGSASGLHHVESDTGKIRSQWISVSPTIRAAKDFQYPGQAQPYKTDSELVKEIQQKLKLRQQMLADEKTEKGRPNLFVPNSRLDAGIFSMAPDDDFLWVLTKSFTSVLLYHPASQTWVGGFSIRNSGMPPVMACGGGKLWLATQWGPYYSILEMDADVLKSIPRDQWLSDTISQGELDKYLSGIPVQARAVYFFFCGEDAAAVALLKGQPEDKLDAESLFLLHTCFAEMGESDQVNQFEQKLDQTFPDSVFSKVSLSMKSTTARITQ